MDQQECADQAREPIVRIEDERRQRQPVTVFRTAALGCDKGRFLCLVRSISPRGLAAELDLELSEGARISVSLGSAPVPATVTQKEGRHIQVAFDEPVAAEVEAWLAGPGSGRRHATRIEIDVQARLQIDGQCLFADLRDISQDGMRIESDHFLIEGDLAAITLRGWTGTIHGRICWTSGGQAGLAFAEPLRLPALMHWLAALAPAARRPRSRRDLRQMVRH